MKRKVLIALATLLLGLHASAQDDVVRIVKTYEPTISDAKKPDFRPKIDDTLSVQASFDYQVVPFQYPTIFQPSKINPAKLLPEVVHPHYGSFVKLGFGSNISPLIDVRLNGKLKKDWYWGVTAFHESAYGPFSLNGKEYYPHFNQNKLKIDARKYLKKHVFTASSDFELLASPYYGYDFDDSLVTPWIEDSLHHQRFILLENKFALKSTSHSKSSPHSSFFLDHYSLWDKHQTMEHELAVSWEFEHEIKNNPIEVESKLEYTNRSSVADTSNAFLFELKPVFIREKEEWKFKLGFNFYTDIDPEKNAEYFIFPEVQFDFALAEDFLHTYFGLTGEYVPGKIRRLALDNPFIETSANLQGTTTPINVYAGFRGKITNELKYHAKAAYKQVKGQAFYYSHLNNSGDYVFGLIYDSTDVFQANAEIAYEFNEKLTAGLTGRYDYYFSMSNETNAWMIPPYAAGIYLKYNLQHKIEVGTDFQVLGKRDAKFVKSSTDINTFTLPEAFDWNIDVEYRYNNKVSAFLEFKNILGNKYYLYSFYPADGFRVYGGLIYSF